jgi:UDP-2,3-diacylglucosamine pyrophosphatase LpxH
MIRNDRPIFVISDLHVGDRSPKDNLCHARREALLDTFLDFVNAEQGQLVIAGDFFELLRYPLERIIRQRRALLDRLARMETVYIPGNHDQDAVSYAEDERPPHPFFERTCHAFTCRVGAHRFKFMHGHEVDPLITAGVQSFGRMIGTVACLLEFRHGTCCLSNERITDWLLETGEHMLQMRDWIARFTGRAVRDCCTLVPDEPVRRLGRRIRTQRMLTRYYADREEGLYDVAIVGHTHKAGACRHWYFNCGSWTGKTNNFLRISPEGRVAVFDWVGAGPEPNHTVVAHA